MATYEECDCDKFFCSGCSRKFYKCKYLAHCETCLSKSIPCLYSNLKCDVQSDGLQMSLHVEHLCPYRPENAIVLPCHETKNDLISSNLCVEHCLNCYSAYCTFENTCGVIQCPKLCGGHLHQCKLSDHLSGICPRNFVQCINKVYGCPATIIRCNMSRHLEKCPANIILCNFHWDRNVSEWKLYQICLDESEESRQLREKWHDNLICMANKVATSHLRRAMALRDQIQLYSSMEKMSAAAWRSYSSSGLVPTTVDNQENSEIPTSESTRYFNDINYIKFTGNTGRLNNFQTIFESYFCDENHLTKEINQLYSCDTSKSQLVNSSSPNNPIKQIIEQECQSIISDRKITDKIHYNKSSSAGNFRFFCNHLVTRNDSSRHFTEHSLIWSPLMDDNGFVEWKCPLSSYGCSFSINHYENKYYNTQLAYYPLTDCFNDRQISSVDGVATALSINITLLPLEILERIFSYLDQNTLKILAVTHQRFSEITLQFLENPNKCIINTKWLKLPAGQMPRWRMSFKRIACFPTEDKYDKRVYNFNLDWKHQQKLKHQHISNCLFKYPINRQMEPFSYSC